MKKSSIVGLFLLTSLTGCANNEQFFDTQVSADYESEVVVEESVEEESSSVEEVLPVVENYSLSLVAAGDNLIHSPIYTKAKQEDGTYDFTPMYEHIKDYIQSFDLAVINQETIYVDDESKVSSYPCFGTPVAMGDAVIDTGFDIVLSATNHTWDKKEYGVDTTLAYWNNHPEITVLGINSSKEDFNTVDIVEKNGFKLAMFNYTYGLNGFVLPEDKQWKVNLLDYKDKFISDLQSVEGSVDFSICFLHIGTEYTYNPTEYQVNYINDLIDAGADIIICAHPHVVEPYQEVTTVNGNTGIVYYSCGNFISAQNEVDRCLGGLAELQLEKEVIDGVVTKCEVTSYTFTPVVTHYNSTEHCVYLLSDYTEELAKTHKLSSKGLSVAKLNELWTYIVGE